MNAAENPENPENVKNVKSPESVEPIDDAANHDSAARSVSAVTEPTDPATTGSAATGPAVTESSEASSEAGPAAPATAEETPAPGGTSVYVRRGRTPTLGFWVAIALAVPAVLALLSAPFFDFVDLGGVVNFVLMAVVFVGFPLAAVAAGVDAFRHRERTPRRR